MTPAAAPRPRGRIDMIELGRGLAALAVVVFHANGAGVEFGGPRFGWLSFGEHGVDFFFVLSGFIIFAAHHDDIGRPGRARAYLLKRLIRLAPLLWGVVLGWAAVRAGFGHPPDAATVLRSLFLWPSLAPALPAVVWTLRHEALFYAAFLLLLVSPRAGRWLFAGWALAAIAQAGLVLAGRPVTGVASMLLSTYTLDFLLGAVVAAAWRRGAVRGGWWPLAIGLGALAAAMVAEERMGLGRLGLADYASPGATFWTLLLGVVFALVVYGLLAVEGRVRVPRWAVSLGAASYAIYLVHTPVNSLAQRIAAHLPAWLRAIGAGHLLLVLAGVLVGFAAHHWFEKPVGDALRRRLLPRRAGALERGGGIAYRGANGADTPAGG